MGETAQAQSATVSIVTKPVSVTKYNTTLDDCDCPAQRYWTLRRPCKHIRKLRDAMETVRTWKDKNA